MTPNLRETTKVIEVFELVDKNYRRTRSEYSNGQLKRVVVVEQQADTTTTIEYVPEGE